MSRANRKADVELRRQKVAVNLQSGLSLTAIANALGVSRATISSDFKAIRAEWQDARLEAAGAYAALENARLDRALNAIWPKVADGQLLAIDRMLKIMERRARLLGLDAPTKQDVTHKVSELSDAELLAYISGQFEPARDPDPI